jgi:hypothetical protein
VVGAWETFKAEYSPWKNAKPCVNTTNPRVPPALPVRFVNVEPDIPIPDLGGKELLWNEKKKKNEKYFVTKSHSSHHIKNAALTTLDFGPWDLPLGAHPHASRSPFHNAEPMPTD